VAAPRQSIDLDPPSARWALGLLIGQWCLRCLALASHGQAIDLGGCAVQGRSRKMAAIRGRDVHLQLIAAGDASMRTKAAIVFVRYGGCWPDTGARGRRQPSALATSLARSFATRISTSVQRSAFGMEHGCCRSNDAHHQTGRNRSRRRQSFNFKPQPRLPDRRLRASRIL
jgi:hypothetical protein